VTDVVDEVLGWVEPPDIPLINLPPITVPPTTLLPLPVP